MRKKWIWLVAAAVIFALIGFKILMGQSPVDVELGKVEQGNIEKLVEEKAEVKLADQLDLYNSSSGIVTDIPINVGDKVKKGQTLIQLDSKSMDLQIAELDAQIRGAKARYSEAASPSTASEISKLEALVKSAELASAEADKQAQNSDVLFIAGAISQEELDASKIDAAAKKAAMLTALDNLNLAKRGISSHVKAEYAAQISSIETKRSLVEKQRDDLTIKAPADGILLAMHVKKGEYLPAGTHLAQVGNTRDMYLSADILMEDMNGIAPGSGVHLINKDLGITEWKGTVRKVFPTAFSKLSELGIMQKRVTVEISIDQTKDTLKPGYEVTAQIIVASNPKALMVDKKALFQEQGNDMVFLNVNGVAALKAVKKGIETDKMVEILSGLSAGDEVIISPDESIKEGTKIK